MERNTILFGDIYLDTDTDPKINKGSDYILNCVITSDGRYKLLVNSKGNKLVFNLNAYYADGTNPKVIGACKDEARNKIIVFVASSTYFNSIWLIDSATNSFDAIVYDDCLILNKNFPVTANVIGDLLYWTDGFSEPKKINYIRAFNWYRSLPGPSYAGGLNADVIEAYKRPNTALLSLNGIDNGTGILKNKNFQFATINVYVDGEKSVLSQFSEVFICNKLFLSSGKGVITSYDQINITITVVSYSDILRTELYVREGDLLDWYLYDTIENPTGTTTYNFNNAKLQKQSDQNELSRPYDYIPKLAKTQELIGGNRLVYANIYEGFNNTITTLSATIITKDTSGTPRPNNLILYIRWDFNYLYFTIDTYTPSNCFIILNIPIVFNIWESNTATSSFYFVYHATPDNTIADIMIFFYTKLNNAIKAIPNPSPAWHMDLGDYNGQARLEGRPYCIRMRTPFGLVKPSDYEGLISGYVNSTVFMNNYISTICYKTIKDKDQYLIGVVYYDKQLRYSTVSKPLVVTTSSNLANYPAYFRVSVKNKPPIWAYYYSLAFSKKQKADSFIQLQIKQGDFFWGEDKLLRIRINKLMNIAFDLNNKFSIPFYVWQNGDRLRIVLRNSSSINDYEILGTEYLQNDSSYTKDKSTGQAYILDANGNKVRDTSSLYIIVNVNYNDYINGMDALGMGNNTNTPANMIKSFMAELYRNKKFSDEDFYFHDQLHSIGNPGLSSNYHVGDIQNQDPNNPSVIPAVLNSKFGDCYYKQRFVKYVFDCIDDNYSDYFLSNIYGLGRPNAFDPNVKGQNIENLIRFGGNFIKGTNINNLNQFYINDRVFLEFKFGSINSVRELGNILKVLQDKKECSIYLSRTELKNADGSSNVVANNSTLGTINYADEDRGTIHPRSVVINNRHMYYWDNMRKEVIRSSYNGQFPISSYGMATYFKNKTGYTNVIAGFDQENSMYLITFIGGISETIGFYEPELENEKPRWISFYSFVPDLYINIGKYLMSFKDNYGNKHNSTNVPRCEFFLSKYKQQVNWYSGSFNRKIFKSIGIKSNKAWLFPSITIEADASYPRGFLSKLNTNHFILKEGVYSASYLNNMLSTSNVAKIIDLINGNKMRGFYIKHQMENNENGEVWVLEAHVDSDISNNY